MTATGLPAPGVARPRTVPVAAMFASAAAFMAFAGLIVVYISERANATGEWFPSGVIELGPATFVLSTLVLSVFTVQWAVQAIGNDDRVNAFVAMGLTGLFAAAVFNQLWFIIGDTGFTLDGSDAEFMFFVVNGAFIAFLIAATVALFLTFLRALLGQFGPRRVGNVAAVAFYWNTVVAMFWLVWYVIYVTK